MQLWNWMKVFSVTISRMKARFVSGQVRPSLCSTSRCGADKEGVSTEPSARGSLLAAGMRQLPHLSLCSFCGSTHTLKIKLWHLTQAGGSIKSRMSISLICIYSFTLFLGGLFSFVVQSRLDGVRFQQTAVFFMLVICRILQHKQQDSPFV